MAKLNTNSNVYTIIYASVMVVLVAFLLAFVSSSLKDKQDANVAIDKKTQILAALNVRGIDKSEVEAQYNAHIDTTCVLTADGQVIEGADAFDVETKEIGEKFPIYMAKTADGKDALVLPVKGRGLWGGLWGYIAVTPDMQTVLGAYFNHESETAGLGALIKDEPFQAQFAGRPVFGEDGKVALTVVKKGSSENASQVDGVTGATLTSKGTGEMVHDGLQAYVDVLSKLQGCEKHDNCDGVHEGCDKHEDCDGVHEGCDKHEDCDGVHEGCDKHEGCPKQHEGCDGHKDCQKDDHKCKSGSDCCKSGTCDKSGSCGKSGCDGDKACCGHK